MVNYLAGSVIGTILFKALAALGVGYVTYSGFDWVMQRIREQTETAITGLPDLAVNIMGLVGVDVYISYIFSAWSTVFIIKAGKKLVF